MADEWDAMRSGWYDEKVIEELAALVQVAPATTLLDMGTGTGFVAAGLAPLRKVIAVDNSSAMLDVARRNLDQLAIDNVELTAAEVDYMPFPTVASTLPCEHGAPSRGGTSRDDPGKWPA